MFATIPLEPFPTLSTIAKLLRCTTIIVADNLVYNKRDKHNQVYIKPDMLLSLEVTGKKQLHELTLLNKDVFNRKFARSIEDHFQKSPYYSFFSDELITHVHSSEHYVDLCKSTLHWFIQTFQLPVKCIYASKQQHIFDLKEIIESRSELYFVEKTFLPYVQSLTKKDVHPFSLKVSTPENYYQELPQNLTFFQLLFDWGNYFPRVIQID